MPKNVFRLFAVILTLCMTAAAVTGCKGRPEENDAGEDEKKVESSTSQIGEENKKVEVKEDPYAQYEPVEGKKYKYIWTYYQTAPLADDPAMKKYWEDKFNVKFEVLDMDNKKAEELINLKIASGVIPDKMSVNAVNLKKYSEQGILAEIPMPVLEKYAPSVKKILDENTPGWDKYGRNNGKMYGIPNQGTDLWATPNIFREDWLKNVGIDKVPETLEEYEEAFYKFTGNDPDKNGEDDTYGLSSNGFTAIFGAFGFIPKEFGMPWTISMWQSRDGKLVFSAIQPEMKQALTLLNKWYNDGVIDPEFITGENQGGYWAISHAFVNGKIGYTGRGMPYHWWPSLTEGKKEGPNRAEIRKLDPGFADSIAYANPPIGPDGKRGVWANPIIGSSFNVFGIDMEKNPDKMGKLLQIYEHIHSSYENYNTAVNGVDGLHWEFKEQVAIVPELAGKKYKVVSGIGEWAKGAVKNANFAHTAMSLGLRPKWRDMPTLNEDYTYNVTHTNKYHISNELLVGLPSEAKYKAELEKLVDEAYISIITGEKPVDYFDEFVRKWKNAGGEILEKEANVWYASLSE